MIKILWKKGLVLTILFLLVTISIGPNAISKPSSFKNTINEESLDVLYHSNIPPIINRTFPKNGAINTPRNLPINVEIYDPNDDLWVEIWSNYTGDWIEYASYDVFIETDQSLFYNASSLPLVDFDGDGEWRVLDATILLGNEGWGQSGNWGFIYNMSVTSEWGMNEFGTTYYWSVNVTDNLSWKNQTFLYRTFGVDVVYVDDDFNESTPGWGYDHFDCIQDGIEAVIEYGTVYVYNGTYFENVIVNKTIELIGESINNTTIDGNNSGDVILISSNNVNISGFTIKNSGYGWSDSGIDVCSGYNRIFNNNISYNNNHGLRMYYSESSNNIIKNNTISSNIDCGIRLCYLSKNNTLNNNTISSNLFHGISIEYDCSGTNISSNLIILNQGSGIDIRYSNLCQIINNSMISNMATGIAIFEPSFDNLIYHNNIINNTLNSYDSCENTWDNDYPSGGNYWDDYNGIDIDGDCIGDTPYNITAGDNQDRYPFMYPNGWINNPPYMPYSPYPADGVSDVENIVNLSWSGGDSDPCDTVTYDVYFGTDSSPSIVSSNQTNNYFDTGTLECNTSYYWKIIAWDNKGASTSGPVWSFSTKLNTAPDPPIISGPNSGKAGDNYIFSFESTDPEENQIYYYIDWGDGNTEEWIGLFNSGEQIYRNHSWSAKGTFVIKAQAKDTYDEIGQWSYHEITMPKSKYIFFNPNVINWLIKNLSDVFPVFEYLINKIS